MKEKKRLMIIDDDRDDIYFFLNAVSKLSEEFDCVVAERGVIAMKQLQTASRLPDFIFLDLSMPLMGGREFLQELKNNSSFKNIPVIIYSTSSSQRDIETLLKMGASYYLPKPMSVADLPTVILNATLKCTQIQTSAN